MYGQQGFKEEENDLDSPVISAAQWAYVVSPNFIRNVSNMKPLRTQNISVLKCDENRGHDYVVCILIHTTELDDLEPLIIADILPLT